MACGYLNINNSDSIIASSQGLEQEKRRREQEEFRRQQEQQRRQQEQQRRQEGKAAVGKFLLSTADPSNRY